MSRIRRLSTVFLGLTVLAAILALPFSSTVRAQGDIPVLPYNEPTIVTLNPGQPVTRVFSVFPGDSFTLTLSRLADFTFSAALIDPQQSAAPLVPGQDGNVILAFDDVPYGGAYTLVLQAAAGSGDMLVLLGGAPVEPVPLSLGETLVDLGETPARYRLTPPEGAPATLLTVAIVPPDPNVPGQPTTLPTLTLLDQDRQAVVLSLEPGALPRIALTLNAPTVYLLSLDPGEVPQQVVINWEVTEAIAPASTEATPTATPTAVIDTTGPCQINFSGGVNVRSGPSTDYPILGVATPGTILPVTGRNDTASWWQVNYAGLVGWVSGGLAQVQLSGNCSGAPIAPAPPLPTPTPTLPAPTPTETLPASYTPTPTVTVTPTFTPTPSATFSGTFVPVTFVPITLIPLDTPFVVVTVFPVTLIPITPLGP